MAVDIRNCCSRRYSFRWADPCRLDSRSSPWQKKKYNYLEISTLERTARYWFEPGGQTRDLYWAEGRRGGARDQRDIKTPFPPPLIGPCSSLTRYSVQAKTSDFFRTRSFPLSLPWWQVFGMMLSIWWDASSRFCGGEGEYISHRTVKIFIFSPLPLTSPPSCSLTLKIQICDGCVQGRCSRCRTKFPSNLVKKKLSRAPLVRSSGFPEALLLLLEAFGFKSARFQELWLSGIAVIRSWISGCQKL